MRLFHGINTRNIGTYVEMYRISIFKIRSELYSTGNQMNYPAETGTETDV